MELSRLLLGFVVAIGVPLSVPILRRSKKWVVLFSAGYAAYCSFWVLSAIKSLAVCLIAVAASLILCRWRAASDGAPKGCADDAVPKAVSPSKAVTGVKSLFTETLRFCRACMTRVDMVVLIVLCCFVVLIASSLYKAGGLERLLDNDRIALVLSGGLLAVFAGNELVLLAIMPYLRALESQGESVGTIIPTGLHIGWIERTIVFSFIAAGEPEAATLAVAAKSLIRIPEVQRHAGVYAQYVVVGTLANLLVALFAAIIVRICSGMPPL
jgi:hypothetical protein